MRQLLMIVFVAGACLRALAQPAMPPGVHGASSGLATRSVSIYLDLERGLLEALEARDRSAVIQKLGPDFTFRSDADVDDVVAADWLDGELRHPVATANVRNLAVRELGEVAVVSFLLDRRAARPGASPSTLYVVDVWQQHPPRLVARYAAQPRHALPVPAKPSGRE